MPGTQNQPSGLLSEIDDKVRVDWCHERESPGRKETELHVSGNTNSLRVGAGLLTQSVAITHLGSQHRPGGKYAEFEMMILKHNTLERT